MYLFIFLHFIIMLKNYKYISISRQTSSKEYYKEIKLNFKIIFISRQANCRYFATYIARIFSQHFPFNLPYDLHSFR